MLESPDILVETVGSLGRIRLNRPKAINALTLEMIRTIEAALTGFENDPAVAAVLVTGEGERGLCAGGDIRLLYEHRHEGTSFGATFFRDEYRMNAHIAAYRKPYIAIMDGITMGGGIGISAHGTVRIVTERTRAAMPEAGIGFFPDIGATWLLGRAPGEIGTFLGLTGESIGGADAIYAGLADFFVPSTKLPALVEALTALPANAALADIRATAQGFAEMPAPPLAAHRAEIDDAFAHDRVEEIVAALNTSGTAFAQKTLPVMAQKSPTSMKVILRLLRLGRAAASMKECLEREFAAAHNVLASDEFYEGVRAAVVDKDRNPKWRPSTLAAVGENILAPYFKPAGTSLF
jgi:enoyl-CoA hydratase